jgi:hypothetical protein
MAEYRPSVPFTTALYLFIPQYVTAKGSTKKVYPETGDLIYCSFKSFGGTEKEVDGVIVIEDTANIETWFRPDITAACLLETTAGARYEIISEPENINMRNQFLKFKIRRIKGGA